MVAQGHMTVVPFIPAKLFHFFVCFLLSLSVYTLFSAQCTITLNIWSINPRSLKWRMKRTFFVLFAQIIVIHARSVLHILNYLQLLVYLLHHHIFFLLWNLSFSFITKYLGIERVNHCFSLEIVVHCGLNCNDVVLELIFVIIIMRVVFLCSPSCICTIM